MKSILNITSGDIAGKSLEKSGIPGEVLVWHDILYDGPRNPGWPDEETLHARARFLSETTGGGLSYRHVLETLIDQYAKLETAKGYENITLWFDACLFDQSMLCHILTCMQHSGQSSAELICIDAFEGIEPYNGLGQLSPEQLASVYDWRQSVTMDQFAFAESVDRAFTLQDQNAFLSLSNMTDAPIPWIPAAAARWLREQPDSKTGLGRLEKLALAIIRSGEVKPWKIFSAVSLKDTPPQYWGDITLWAKINALADRNPPLVRIEGPNPRLPQWEGVADLKLFRVYPCKTNESGSHP